MTEVGEGTLTVTYKGSEISIRLIGKAIASALDDIGKGRTQARVVQPEKENAERQEYTYSSVNESADIKEVVNEFRGYDVDFAVLKNPTTNEYLLLFKANDSATIKKAMREYLGKVDRELELTVENSINDGLRENSIAADAQEKAALIAEDVHIIEWEPPPRQGTGELSLAEKEANLKDFLQHYTAQAKAINQKKEMERGPQAPERGHTR